MRTIAQERSPLRGDVHHAAVRPPPADPFEMQLRVGPETRVCPSRALPVARPTSATSAFFASSAVARGHGWFGRQLPSLSRAAIPATRMRGPSSHQMGPSPSQTRVGVHANVPPAGITTEASIRRSDRDRSSAELREVLAASVAADKR